MLAARANARELTAKELSGYARTAVMNGAQKTQFTPGATRRPLLWSTTYGQVLFQFKNYAMGQSRFLADQIFREAYQGNYRPLAYFASIYPVAGEFVKDVRTIIQGKKRDPDNGFERLMQNFVAVGGFGIISDFYSSSRWSRLLEWAVGPSMADGVDIIQAMFSGRFNNARAWAARQPITTTSKFVLESAFGTGNWLYDNIEEYIKLSDAVDYSKANPEPFEYMELGEFTKSIPTKQPLGDVPTIGSVGIEEAELRRRAGRVLGQ